MQTKGLPTIYTVLHQAEGWRATLCLGGEANTVKNRLVPKSEGNIFEQISGEFCRRFFGGFLESFPWKANTGG